LSFVALIQLFALIQRPTFLGAARFKELMLGLIWDKKSMFIFNTSGTSFFISSAFPFLMFTITFPSVVCQKLPVRELLMPFIFRWSNTFPSVPLYRTRPLSVVTHKKPVLRSK